MQRAVVGFFAVLFLALFAGIAGAQDQAPPRRGVRPMPPTPAAAPQQQQQPQQQPGENAGGCPTVVIQAQPGQVIRDGQPIVFMANVAGGDPKVAPTLVWNTSAGTITQGQDSRRIQVDSTGAGGTSEREIRADLWIGGYAPECGALQSSVTVKVIAPAVKYGEFGEVDAQTLKTNLEALANSLSQSPDNLYLIAYAGRNSERGFTANWAKKIKDSLIASGVEPRRIYAVDGGFREQPLFDFWIVPMGAEPPRPAPTIKRTEIVYPKTTTPAKKP